MAVESVTGIPVPTVKNGIKYGGRLLTRKPVAEGVETALSSGAYQATVEAAKKANQIKKQAKSLISENNNRNRVTLRSESRKVEIDLDGKSHAGIPTPHTKISPRNEFAPQGKKIYNTSESKSTLKPTTQREIRTVRKYLQKRKKSGKR